MSKMGGVDSPDELHPLKQEELVSATTAGCFTAAASLHQAHWSIVQVAKATVDKKFERKVRDRWRHARRNSMVASPGPISQVEVFCVLKCVKLGTAPGYDNIHPEFLKHLGPFATTWLSTFFPRVVMEQCIPWTRRQAKVIALQKPGKDPHVAATVHYHF